MIYRYTYPSPLGMLTLTSDADALTGIWMEEDNFYPIETIQQAADGSRLPVMQKTVQWLEAYFAGYDPSPAGIPLAPMGTPFQLEVWDILKEIPYGKTVTYGQIAGRIAERHGISSMSAQAVGNAVGRNPISILVPCHRVVGARGHLTGYAAGLWRKEILLKLEEKG